MATRRTFNERLGELVGFVALHGRAPRKHVGGSGESLALWLASQSKRRPLRPEQERALRATGVWPVPKKDNWEQRYAELSEFWEHHGRLPLARDPNEGSLANWMTRQRVHLRDGSLPVDREMRLGRLNLRGASVDDVEWWWQQNLSICLAGEGETQGAVTRANAWLADLRTAAANGELSRRRTLCLAIEGLLDPGPGDLVGAPSWVFGYPDDAAPREWG